ncbi:MAG: hypothetical protein ACOCOP_08740 [Prevotella sp.]
MSSRGKINWNVAKRWAIVGNSMRYKRAAVREASWNSLDDIKEEAFDGILITLSSHNSGKSLNVQKRILRRIVEKRQAQIAHRYMGHTDDLTASHLASVYISKCMEMLHQYQNCI